MAEPAAAVPALAGGHGFWIRVYYEDTDAGGIVYHASYLRFAERARTEWLRSLGFDHTRLRAEHGLLFAVRRCVLEFRAPAVLDDLLCVATSLVRLGGASLDLRQLVQRDGRPLAELSVGLVSLNLKLKPLRLPPSLIAALGPR